MTDAEDREQADAVECNDEFQLHSPLAAEHQHPIAISSGHYLGCAPGYNTMEKYRRVSNYGEVLTDKTMLQNWEHRKLVAATLKWFQDEYNRFGEQSVKAEIDRYLNGTEQDLAFLTRKIHVLSSIEQASNAGTEMHTVVQEGLETSIDELAEQRRYHEDVIARVREVVDLLRGLGNPILIEQLVFNEQFDTIGRFDYLIQSEKYGYVIVDLKTTKPSNLEMYGPLTVSVQLALYATATHMWQAGEWVQNSYPINLDKAIVLSVPQDGSSVEFYEVDIHFGQEYAELAAEVLYARQSSHARRREIIKKLDSTEWKQNSDD